MKYIISKPHSIYELGKRANQEDNIYPKHGEATINDSLFIVCDGMGGHESGEVASSTVCETMSSYINKHVDGYNFNEHDFQSALSATYDALDTKDNGAEKKMGTTMTFMKFHSEGCLMAHIGDSRMYHIRPSAEKKSLFISVDHSLVNDLIAIGELTKEEAKTSRQKNIITRALQPNQERRAKAAVKLISDIQVGDYFYICTDGMLEEMEDDNVANILSMDNDDNEKIRILTELTVGNKDNHSAYLIRIEGVVDEDNTVVQDDITEVSDNIASEDIEVEQSKVFWKKLPPRKVKKSIRRHQKSNFGSRIKFAASLIIIFAIAFFVYRTFANSDLEVEEPKTINQIGQGEGEGENPLSLEAGGGDVEAAKVGTSKDADVTGDDQSTVEKLDSADVNIARGVVGKNPSEAQSETAEEKAAGEE